MAATHPAWGDSFTVPAATTAADLERLSHDGHSYELYEGILVREMTFGGHGDLCQRLGVELGLYARATGFANRIVQNTLFDLTPPGAILRTVLAPDLAILRGTASPSWDTILDEPPLLAVEVVSQSQTLAELALKAQTYLQAGVDEVWLIDHRSQTIEVWSPRGTATLPATATLTSPLLPGLSLPIQPLLNA